MVSTHKTKQIAENEILDSFSFKHESNIDPKFYTCSTSQANCMRAGKIFLYRGVIGAVTCRPPGCIALLPSMYKTKECKSSQAATLVCRSLDVVASSTTLGKKTSVRK